MISEFRRNGREGPMFTEERHVAIEQCLREKGKVKVKELSEKFQVSEETYIRGSNPVPGLSSGARRY